MVKLSTHYGKANYAPFKVAASISEPTCTPLKVAYVIERFISAINNVTSSSCESGLFRVMSTESTAFLGFTISCKVKLQHSNKSNQQQ